MKAIEIACRRCDAQPGEYCSVVDGRGVVIKSACAVHAERIEDAASISTDGTPVSEAQFREAVEQSGRLF